MALIAIAFKGHLIQRLVQSNAAERVVLIRIEHLKRTTNERFRAQYGNSVASPGSRL